MVQWRQSEARDIVHEFMAKREIARHGGGDGKEGKRKAKMEAEMEASTRIDG